MLALVRERGSLTHAQVREVSGWGRAQVQALVAQLVLHGEVERRGAGRGVHVVLAGETNA